MSGRDKAKRPTHREARVLSAYNAGGRLVETIAEMSRESRNVVRAALIKFGREKWG